jgi:hypothetical protein
VTQASQRARRGGGKLAAAQLAVALLLGGTAWFIAPDLDTAREHERFKEFFATSAQVIAAVLIALAVEARFVARRPLLVLVTASSVAVGEVSAIAALSPELPGWMYTWLFALTVGAGGGGLFAAIVVGAQVLATDIEAERVSELDQLLDRRKRDEAAG